MKSGAKLILDNLLRELAMDAPQLTRMLGLPPISRQEPTDYSYVVEVRGDHVATLVDGSVSHIEWQLHHDSKMGRRIVEMHEGITRQLKPKKPIHQTVIRVGNVRRPKPIVVRIAGAKHSVKVLTGRDLDLEPVFASSHLGDKMIACLLTPDLKRLVEVGRSIRDMNEMERPAAKNWFYQVALFRQQQDEMTEEVVDMIQEVIEIDLEHNPLTSRPFQKAQAESEMKGQKRERLRVAQMMLERVRQLSPDEGNSLKDMDEDELSAVVDAAMDLLRDETDTDAREVLEAALRREPVGYRR